MKRLPLFAVALLIWQSFAWADVKQESPLLPAEHLIEAERDMAITEMQDSWRAFLHALELGDAAEASELVDPNRRSALMNAGPFTNRVRIAQALSAQFECASTISVRFARCSYWVKNSRGGLEEIRIPFVRRQGQWYISF